MLFLHTLQVSSRSSQRASASRPPSSEPAEPVARCVPCSLSLSRSSTDAGRSSSIACAQSDGYCFRLYPEQVFNTLDKRTQPEIQRVSLTFALLHLLAAGQADVFEFHFMDKPDKDSSASHFRTRREPSRPALEPDFRAVSQFSSPS